MLEDMRRILQKTKGIHGLMTVDELTLLCRFAQGASSICELGSYQGRSLIAMGLANPNAKLYGVDWFGDMSHRGYQGSTLEETQFNLKSRGVQAEFYVGTTDEVAPRFIHEIDLLHVDAGHSYEECLADLNNYTPKIKPGGAVLIHDYGQARKDVLDRPEVKEAVDDWAKNNPEWVEVARVGTMIAFRHMIAEKGALYIAYGEKAMQNYAVSASLLKKHAPDLPIAVITDTGARLTGLISALARPDGTHFEAPEPDFIIEHVDMDRGVRAIKTRMYQLSPFRKTFYLDADTEVQSSPDHGFDLLELVDLVIGQDSVQIFNRNHHPHMVKEEMRITKDETGGGEYCYYNSGVMFFGRNERTKNLMQCWHDEWQRFGVQDQPALFRAMHRCPVRIAAMRSPWNTHHSKDAQFVFHAHRRARREGAPM